MAETGNEERIAANVRRALIALIGDAPEDGDQPTRTRFASDVGQLRAVIDAYWSDVPLDLVAVAEYARRFAAGHLAAGQG
jgi:hypothetical protein